MPKPTACQKTLAIRDYLRKHPDLSPKDLTERIRNETDFKTVSNDEVSKIKSAYRAQMRPQGQPKTAPEAPSEPTTRHAPAANGSPRRQPGLADTVHLVHRLLAGVGSAGAREVVDLVVAMGPDEAHRLIDVVEQIETTRA